MWEGKLILKIFNFVYLDSIILIVEIVVVEFLVDDDEYKLD